PQLEALALELLEPLALVRGQSRAAPLVALGLPHPVPERLRRAPDLLRDRYDGRPLRVMLILMLEHHPHRALSDFWGEPTRSCHGPILSKSGASEKPGRFNLARLILEPFRVDFVT